MEAPSSDKGKKKNKKLPDHLEENRTRVKIGLTAPSHSSTYESASIFDSMGFDNAFDMDEFREKFQIKIQSISSEEMVFDVIGVDAPIANALRRILIAEVPTMAIETVYIFNNTGVMQDEVLAHRLGLIPIKADPREFKYRGESGATEPHNVTDEDTIVFKLNVTCTRNPQASKDAPPSEKYINESVYAKDLKWDPQGRQKEQFAESPISVVHDDILITKLRPGQSIELEARCAKGIGKTHSKWSPVATATYRLMPEIKITTDVKNEEADELVKVCPLKVFDIEDLANGDRKARVANPRACSMCRECIRQPQFQDKVKLARIKNHFIFSIESTGVLHPKDIFVEAIKVFMDKCTQLEQELDGIAAQ